MKRRIHLVLGWLAFLLGGVGMALPLLPTVPLWILAAWFFTRSDPRLRDWIYRHPRFGRSVRDYLEEGILVRRGKVLSIAGLTIGVGLSLAALRLPLYATLAAIAVTLAVVVYLATRPERRAEPPVDLRQHGPSVDGTALDAGDAGRRA